MIAGGTGISPMLQVMEKILSDPNDKTQVSLVFANTTPQDILLKERLDALAKQYGPNRVKVTYVVDKPDAAWKGSKGYITRDLLSNALPQPGVDNFTYVCGPPGFMEHVSGNKNLKDFSQGELKGLLKEMGWTESNVLKF
jgi:cytochrome-b5 reductase